jgi:hypothetical protein
MSIAVFTYDSRGVKFPDSDIEKQTAQALTDLLDPGGIIVCNNGIKRFNYILEEGGLQFVKSSSYTMLQKPF